jgi:ParB family chromosome partitioning protein
MALVGERANTREAVIADGKFRVLQLDQIDFDPLQPRQYFDQAGIDSLAASIEAQGVLHLPICRPNPREPGRHMVVIGERRMRALRQLGKETAEVRYESWSDLQARAAQIVENSEHARKDVRAWEEATAFGQLETLLGSSKAIVEVTGIPYAHISKRLALLKLPDPIKGLLIDGVLTDSETAYSLGTLWGLDREEATRLITKGKDRGRLERDWVRLAMKAARTRETLAKKDAKSEGGSDALQALQRKLDAMGKMKGHRVIMGKGGGIKVELRFSSIEEANSFFDEEA